jgi:hypothetical protein
LAAAALDLSFQVVNPSLKRLAVGIPKRFHTGIIRRDGICSCTNGGWGDCSVTGWGANQILWRLFGLGSAATSKAPRTPA